MSNAEKQNRKEAAVMAKETSIGYGKFTVIFTAFTMSFIPH